MRTTIILIIANILVNFVTCLQINPNKGYLYPTQKWFDQRLDHFDLTDDRSFKQRYFVSDQYWDKSSGPLFFYTGNEGDVTSFINNTGFIWDIAPMFKAKVVFAEHRFYGLSLPFGEQKPNNRTKKEFSKLNSEQALADYALILTSEIEQARQLQNKKLKIICFGGSYGGMLSAWIRIKYPHIVDGSVASSAPVNYFYGQVDCSLFNKVVTDGFKQTPINGEMCTKNIQRSWKVIKQFDEIDEGMEKLSFIFKTCEKLKTSQQLVDWIADTFGELAMVNYPYAANFLADLPAWPLNKTCNEVSQNYQNDFQLLVSMQKALGVFHNFSGNAECFNIGSTDDSKIDGSLWEYQTCTEMVMPFCSNGQTDLFPPSSWNLLNFTLSCQKKYGTTPRSRWEVTNYGGSHLKYATNILFMNGLLDPWHVGSPMKSVSTGTRVVNMWGAAHHLDLRHVREDLPQSVKDAHQVEVDLIRKWLA